MRKRWVGYDRVAFEVKGTPAYTLNILSRTGVSVRGLRTYGSTFRFYVSPRDRDKTEKLLASRYRVYTVTEEKSIKNFFKGFITRYAFIAGLLISVFFTYTYITAVTEVRFEGNAEVSSERLAEAVDGMAATPSVYVKPDLKGMEKAVLAVDGVAYAKARKEGRRIIVKVIEELPLPEVTDTQTPVPLTASESGIVTRVVTLRGTPAVKEGDTVERGAELVHPYITTADGGSVPTRAMGIVEARVTRTEAAEYPAATLADSDIAPLVSERTAAFRAGLGDGELFLGSSFEVKRLDKSTLISIYYVVITRIS